MGGAGTLTHYPFHGDPNWTLSPRSFLAPSISIMPPTRMGTVTRADGVWGSDRVIRWAVGDVESRRLLIV